MNIECPRFGMAARSPDHRNLFLIMRKMIRHRFDTAPVNSSCLAMSRHEEECKIAVLSETAFIAHGVVEHSMGRDWNARQRILVVS